MQQSGGQYGVPDVPQFVVGRVPSSTSAAASAHSHIFSLSSHDIPVENSSSALHQQQDMVSTQQQPKIRLESDSTQMVVPSTNPPNFINNNNTNTDICFDKQVVVPVSTENPNQQLVAVGGGGGGDDDTLDCERGSAGNRWPRQETLALLKIRSEMDANFRDASLKGPLWEEVSRRLSDLGYYRSAKKCKEKFENVHKYYKRTKEGRAGRQDGKSYKFFSQLEALYGNNNTTNHNAKINNNNSSSISNKVTVAAIGGGGIGSGAIGAAPIAVSTREIDNTPSTIKAAPQAPFRIERSSMDFSAFNFSTDTNSSEEESDEDQEDDSEQTDPNTRKRKRSTTSSMMAFFENLMKQVIEKQEAMQQKFLEAIEKREQDRMIREEAWKRQEMARLSREQELKSQERSLTASRDAALMAFLQKVTGETLQIPQLAATIQNVTLAPAPPPPPQPPENEQHNSDQEHQNHDKEIVPFDPNSMKRWPKPEVLALIKIRSGMEQRFHEAGPKGPLWEEISQGMACLGYIRSAKRCKEKWENINKYFRKAKESNKKRPENAKTCPYFHQLDALYRKKVLGNPSRQNKIMDHEYDGGSGGGHDQENKIIIHEDQNMNLIEQQQTRESNREENSPHSLQQGGSGGATNPDASSADILAIMPPPPPSEPVAYRHERSGSSTTARDNASFIAMVQKLASSADATDFNMSTSSNTE